MTEQIKMNWFVVHTHTGFESQVREAINQKFREKGREDELGDVMILSEEQPSTVVDGIASQGYGVRRGIESCTPFA